MDIEEALGILAQLKGDFLAETTAPYSFGRQPVLYLEKLINALFWADRRDVLHWVHHGHLCKVWQPTLSPWKGGYLAVREALEKELESLRQKEADSLH